MSVVRSHIVGSNLLWSRRKLTQFSKLFSYLLHFAVEFIEKIACNCCFHFMAWRSRLNHCNLGSTLIIPQKLLWPGWPIAPRGCIQCMCLSLCLLSSSSVLGSLSHFLLSSVTASKLFFPPLWALFGSDCSGSSSCGRPLNVGIVRTLPWIIGYNREWPARLGMTCRLCSSVLQICCGVSGLGQMSLLRSRLHFPWHSSHCLVILFSHWSSKSREAHPSYLPCLSTANHRVWNREVQ